MKNVGFYSFCVYYVISLISNFRVSYLELAFSHSMCVLNAMNVCCYEWTQEIFNDVVQSFKTLSLNDGVKTHEGDVKTERDLNPNVYD